MEVTGFGNIRVRRNHEWYGVTMDEQWTIYASGDVRLVVHSPGDNMVVRENGLDIDAVPGEVMDAAKDHATRMAEGFNDL